MLVSALRMRLLALAGAEPTYPFGPQPLVVKVGGKMFALLSEDATPHQLSLKCDPYHADMLREAHPAITPGYHLNKRHWITIALDDSVPDDLLQSLIDESYALVLMSLPRRVRETLAPPTT